ncbi:uncharacterized protein TRIADDRAFT_58212 [Trichoplax adhaerens]|uniref:Uncharacterized protein n=1 Tax=Trichoplax adhaerens TaxID=10228 RepID=B3S164_TRIAD|nr:predicted protein [Trichoplax adhaerens]EDV23183.1 predicted protein [Trichoplax adhaerens]|eukprot:XP_002114093.1 predicted protein [Trichoplax adhaerens]
MVMHFGPGLDVPILVATCISLIGLAISLVIICINVNCSDHKKERMGELEIPTIVIEDYDEILRKNGEGESGKVRNDSPVNNENLVTLARKISTNSYSNKNEI